MKVIASGHVFDINVTSFWCRMETQDGNRFDAEIDIDKLSKRERPLLAEGAYVSILKGGTIRFTRTKPWLLREIVNAKKQAKKWEKLFKCHTTYS